MNLIIHSHSGQPFVDNKLAIRLFNEYVADVEQSGFMNEHSYHFEQFQKLAWAAYKQHPKSVPYIKRTSMDFGDFWTNTQAAKKPASPADVSASTGAVAPAGIQSEQSSAPCQVPSACAAASAFPAASAAEPEHSSP